MDGKNDGFGQSNLFIKWSQMENLGPLGTRGDFVWPGKLFPDYLDMFYWQNMTSDVVFSLTAVPESCQFKLRVTRK